MREQKLFGLRQSKSVSEKYKDKLEKLTRKKTFLLDFYSNFGNK